MSLFVAAGSLFLITHGLCREADTLLGKIKRPSENITAAFFGLSFVLNGWVLGASDTLNNWFDYLLFFIWLFFMYGIAYAASDKMRSVRTDKSKVLAERVDIIRCYPSFGLFALFVLWVVMSFIGWLVG